MEYSNYLTSENYIHASTILQHGNAQGLLYVENPSDISFWRCIVQHLARDRYVVKPVSKEIANGKRTLEKMYPDLHKSLLVGVDSDFDYICPERHANAAILNQNCFVLHTFAYSRESYECCHDAISGLCETLYFHDQLPSEIHAALSAYSCITYPALCLFAFLHNQDWQRHTDGLFIEAVKTPAGTCLLQDDLTINQAVISQLETKVQEYIDTYSEQIDDQESYTHFVENLHDKNINEETAYLFIDGHGLQEKIIKPMLKKTIKLTKLGETEHVKTTYANEAQKATQRTIINEINNFYKRRNLDALFFTRQDYTELAFYTQIRGKFQAVLDS